MIRIAPLFLFLGVTLACGSEEARRVRAMPIADVDLSALPDSTFRGEFTYGKFTYAVQATVRDHRIEKIDILQNRNSKYAKKAEGVIPRIVERQTPNVDAISGATTTSKALMKAVENSLTGKNTPVPGE
jgi:uncharacterized protein with FMN-binding domain